MIKLIMFVVSFAIMGCSGRVEKDSRPTFRIDPAQPFRLEFGQGSGWHGLDTVKIDQAGFVVLHRMKQARQENVIVTLWETASLQLTPAAMTEILKAFESNGLMGLHKAYYDDNIHDGTQWVLWVRQGEQEKSIYFNNSFPRPIIRFAEQLDGILATAGLDKVVWRAVPASESRQHESELWASINR